MQEKRGFTLLEVLVVVVIALSVAVFAVPAYKKTQDLNNYTAAQGVLLNLGSAVRNLQMDASAAGKDDWPKDNSVQVTASWQNAANATDPDIVSKHKTVAELETADFPYALFAMYMAPIPFTNEMYKGFKFYVCPANTKSSSTTDCCNKDREVVACMMYAGSTRATGDQYYGALFKTDGALHRLKKK